MPGRGAGVLGRELGTPGREPGAPGREPGVAGLAPDVAGLEPDTTGREPGTPGRELGLLGTALDETGGGTGEPGRALGLGLGTSLGTGTVLEPIAGAPERIPTLGPLRTSPASPSMSASVMERWGIFPSSSGIRFLSTLWLNGMFNRHL